MVGSCQTLESMGSSVKLTNMEIITAATIVMPNSWKNLPMMPPMKPMGRNTATMDSVVASTARPISCVPSSAAACASLPICTWRTMFSRTTMASSISRPTHSDSAISVIMLIEKPNQYMNKKVPISAIGSVSPVITVERQEFRNRKTMSTVSAAPSISVWRTLLTATRMGRALSAIGSSRTPAGTSAAISRSVAFRPSTTSMVFSSWAFCTDSSRVRLLLYRATVSSSPAPSCTRASWPSRTGAPPRWATMMRSKSCGRFMRASICTTRSCSRERMAPSGRSWFSLRTAFTIWSGVMA